MTPNTIHTGDCLPWLRGLPDACAHAVVTDPPYELGFMGKSWDSTGIAYNVDVWRECLRVLKPGGYLLAFGGTRTYHRMTCAIEDAGFEIRDQINWLFGQGFSKSWNLKRMDICACIPGGNMLQCGQKGAGHESEMHSLRESDRQTDGVAKAGQTADMFSQMQRQEPGNASREVQREHEGAKAKRQKARKREPLLAGREICGAGQGVCDDSECPPSQGASERICSGAHSGCGKDVGASAETERGSSPHQPESGRQPPREPPGVCLPPRSLDAGTLSGRGVCPRCGKLRPAFEGFGTALKPAHEPICVARKPLSEKTVAANVLKHGTGAVNVDGCRVGPAADMNPKSFDDRRRKSPKFSGILNAGKMGQYCTRTGNVPSGRWPPNLVLSHTPGCSDTCADGCPVKALAEQSGDTGTAARFFPQFSPDPPFLYCAKASRKERNAGCEGLAEKTWKEQGFRNNESSHLSPHAGAGRLSGLKNAHPTVKPLALMRWLVRLVTPPGGIVLDPFCGSGSTCIAATQEGFQYLGCDQDPESVTITLARLKAVSLPLLEGAQNDRQSCIVNAELKEEG